MLTYQQVKDNHGKTVTIKKSTADCWVLGEMIMALPCKMKKVTMTAGDGLDLRVDSGVVEFDNGCKVKIV